MSVQECARIERTPPVPDTTISPFKTALAASAIALCSSPWVQAAIEYELVLLPNLPGGSSSIALGINEAGTVVGASTTPNTFYENATCWLDGKAIDITGLGISGAQARGINQSGSIVGYSDEIDSNAFLFNDGSLEILDSPGICCSLAVNINDAGMICGNVPLTGIGTNTAVIWIDGQWEVLGSLGGQSSYAHDINEHGQIVGSAWISGTQSRPFIWDEGVMSELPVPGGLNGQFKATGINDHGTIIGQGEWLLFKWEDDELTLLEPLTGGLLGYVNDINNEGVIVGKSYGDGFTGSRACRWIDGAVENLNDLVEAEADWKMINAKAINNKGQIVGLAMNDDFEYRAYVLSPIIEPCPGDLSGDGVVNVQDLLAVIAGWGDPWDVKDLLEVISNWGSCP